MFPQQQATLIQLLKKNSYAVSNSAVPGDLMALLTPGSELHLWSSPVEPHLAGSDEETESWRKGRSF